MQANSNTRNVSNNNSNGLAIAVIGALFLIAMFLLIVFSIASYIRFGVPALDYFHNYDTYAMHYFKYWFKIAKLKHSIFMPREMEIGTYIGAVPILFILAHILTTREERKQKAIRKKDPSKSFFALWDELKSFTTVRIDGKSGFVLGAVHKNYPIYVAIRWLKTNKTFALQYFFRCLAYTLLFVFKILSYIPILGNIAPKMKFLILDAPLSGMCIAPAGSGKTAGVVLPTVLNCDNDNLIINDPKGEIYDLTARYRGAIGKVIVFNVCNRELSNRWNPLDLAILEGDMGRESIFIKIDELTSTIANVLVVVKKGDYWSQSANQVFSNYLKYFIISNLFKNKPATIGAVQRYLNNIAVSTSEHHQEALEEDPETDIVKLKAQEVVEDIESINNASGYTFNGKFYTIDEKAKTTLSNILEIVKGGINDLAGQASSTRSSTLGTLNASLKVFNSINVDACTSKTDIDLNWIRSGYPNPNGQGTLPVTVYLVSNSADQETYGALMALFVQVTNNFMIKLGMPKKGDRNFRFILDEVGFFPPIDAVKEAPAIVRGYKGSYLYICQNISQMEEKYAKTGVGTINTNTAFKLFLTQNDTESATNASKILGNTIKNDPNDPKRVITTPLMESAEIQSLDNTQIAAVQGKGNRPIKCRPPMFFKYDYFLKKMDKSKSASFQFIEDQEIYKASKNIEKNEEIKPNNVQQINEGEAGEENNTQYQDEKPMGTHKSNQNNNLHNENDKEIEVMESPNNKNTNINEDLVEEITAEEMEMLAEQMPEDIQEQNNIIWEEE